MARFGVGNRGRQGRRGRMLANLLARLPGAACGVPVACKDRPRSIDKTTWVKNVSPAPVRMRKDREATPEKADPKERRRHRRVELPAVARVFAGERFLGVFGVADLSVGGAAL